MSAPASLKKPKKPKPPLVPYFKVSVKGGISVYNLGKWPVTLYRAQWEKLIEHAPELLAFIQENSDKLAVKLPIMPIAMP